MLPYDGNNSDAVTIFDQFGVLLASIFYEIRQMSDWKATATKVYTIEESLLGMYYKIWIIDSSERWKKSNR